MDLRVAASDNVQVLVRLDRMARTNPERSAFIAKAVADGSYVIAALDEVIAGYGVLEYSFFGNGFISMLYVGETHRRTGIGAALLADLKDRCTMACLGSA